MSHVRRSVAAALAALVTTVSGWPALAAGTVYYYGNGDCRDIAMTYDEEFGDTTQSLLDTINDLGIRTTWFMLGDSVDSYTDLVREVAERHQVGNHTYDHPQMPKLTEAQQRREITRAEAAIKDVVGVDPRPFWRPPYGEYSDLTVEVADEEGYPYTVMWSIDTRDWDGPSVETIRRRIVDGAFPGAIVLQHGFVPNTVKATRLAVQDLKEQGYQFLTVSEILGVDRGQRDFGGDTYVVQDSEDMGHIGRCHNVTGPRLAAYNDLVTAPAGTVLRIPHKTEIIVRLDGSRLSFPVYPRLVSGRSMVHVRLAEQMGAAVSWDGARVTVAQGAHELVITPGERIALVDGVETDMGAAAIMRSDRVLVPARFVAEQLGGTVTWDQSTYTVRITSPD